MNKRKRLYKYTDTHNQSDKYISPLLHQRRLFAVGDHFPSSFTCLSYVCVHWWCSFRGRAHSRCLFRARFLSRRRLFRLVLARPETLEMRLNPLQLLLQYFAFPWQHLVQLVAWGTTLPSPAVTMATRSPAFSAPALFLVVVFWVAVAVALPGAVTSEERRRVWTITPPHPSTGLTTITRDSRPRRAVRPSPESPATSAVHWARVGSATVGGRVSHSVTSHSVNPRTPWTLLSGFLTFCAILLLRIVRLVPGILCVLLPVMLFVVLVTNCLVRPWGSRAPWASHGSEIIHGRHPSRSTPRASPLGRTIHEPWSAWMPTRWSARWPARWSAWWHTIRTARWSPRLSARWSARWSPRLSARWFARWSPRRSARWSAWGTPRMSAPLSTRWPHRKSARWSPRRSARGSPRSTTRWSHVRHHSGPVRRSTATVMTAKCPSLSILSRTMTVRSSSLVVRRRFFFTVFRHGVDQRLHVVHDRSSLCIDTRRLYKSVGRCICCGCSCLGLG